MNVTSPAVQKLNSLDGDRFSGSESRPSGLFYSSALGIS